jgi:hypothetical protein
LFFIVIHCFVAADVAGIRLAGGATEGEFNARKQRVDAAASACAVRFSGRGRIVISLL